ncbi:pinopsin [Gallus gallus]|uniref:pinopsin n=1 Tax=Gallus gallus TaxID=9031 RepID=UPI0000171262|nr:pinopsin [Gallus gallus]AAA64223.1 pinopsin [Gallus gallus]prf//2022322A pinopsin [Gallus gallus]|eukprot:NP_990740.1 pinopsin [Gallus gallus]
MSSNSSQAPPNGTPGPFDGPQWPYQAPQSTYVGVAVLMGTVVACASVVNGLVIVVSICYKKLRSPLNYILVNLAVADLLVTLCGSSVSLSNNINGFFVFGRRMCELEGFMVSLTGIVGLWSLAILALERYVVVCRPLGDFQFQRRHAVSGCAFTWGWALLWSTPPLLGWSSYVPEGLRTSCGPNWYTGGSNNNSYILSLFVTCFVLPLSLILFSYTNLLLTLRAAAAQQKEADTTQRAEREVTRMVIVMVMAFLLCWLPYSTFALVVATHKGIIIQPVLASLPSYFSKTATVYNPIIYVFMNKQFQSCLLEMLCCGYQPQRTGKASPGTPGPHADVTAAGLRNKVMPAHPV